MYRGMLTGKGTQAPSTNREGSGAVRYSYKHSILAGGSYFKGRCVPESQRISVMLRVRLGYIILQNSSGKENIGSLAAEPYRMTHR